MQPYTEEAAPKQALPVCLGVVGKLSGRGWRCGCSVPPGQFETCQMHSCPYTHALTPDLSP